METGPLTVLGDRPSLIDPLVQHLVSRIERHSSQGSHLEVEARIGCLEHRGSRDRMTLPIQSETLLKPPSNAHSFEFASDVGQNTFNAIKKHLLEISKGQLSASHPVFKINNVRETETVDEFYEQPGGDRVRVTLQDDEVVEVIVKQRLDVLDMYSGSANMDERPFDLRLSVNSEKKLANFTRDGTVNARREKSRTSFELKGFIIDMTRVKVKDRSGDRTSYEVEIELKTDLLVDQLKRKQDGKSHFLYELLTDFVFSSRDLAHSFMSSVGASDIVPELIKQNDNLVKCYLREVGSIQPIIGDYIYQIALAKELKPIALAKELKPIAAAKELKPIG